MDNVLLRINGVDFTPYLAEGGLEWKRNDLDSKETGRTTMDGVMHRARIAVKNTWNVSCKPVSDSEIRMLLNAIYPTFVTAELYDPMRGKVALTMYSNNVSVKLKRRYKDGNVLWEGLHFPLIER